jgi:hypothetical protein
MVLCCWRGSMLLQGLNQQQRSAGANRGETQAIRETAGAHSALQWGKALAWTIQDANACRALLPRAGAPACAFLTHRSC